MRLNVTSIFPFVASVSLMYFAVFNCSHDLSIPVCLYNIGWVIYTQNIVKKDPGRARQKSLAIAGTTSPNLERIIKSISVQSPDLSTLFLVFSSSVFDCCILGIRSD